MFKTNIDSEENKESRSTKDSHRRQRRREKLVLKKRVLAEQQEAATAAHEESQQEATTPESVIPDASFSSNSAAEDADLNNRIDEIFEEFQSMDEE
jgi:hypothetical protein